MAKDQSRDQVPTTAAAIKSLDGGAFVTLHSRLDRGGALQARKLASGAVQLYWRYSLGDKSSREPIGIYDPSAPPKKLQPTARGFGTAAALEKCRELSVVHAARADTGGLRQARADKRESFMAHKAAEAEKSTRTLQEATRLLCRDRVPHVAGVDEAMWTPARSSNVT